MRSQFKEFTMILARKCTCAWWGCERRWCWGGQVNLVSSRYNLPRWNVFFMFFLLFVVNLLGCFDETMRFFLHIWKMRACMNSNPDDSRLYGNQPIIRQARKKRRPWIRNRLKWKCYRNMLSHFYPAGVFYSHRFILCVPQNILVLYFLWIFAYMFVYLIKISLRIFQDNFSDFQLDKLHFVSFRWQPQESEE